MSAVATTTSATVKASGAYVQRKINVQVDIAHNQDALIPREVGGYDTYKLTGLRASVHISLVGGAAKGDAHIRIFGVRQDLQNKLSNLGLDPVRTQNNVVTVSAGDVLTGMPIAFQGSIKESWLDFEGIPEQFMEIHAAAGYFEAIKPIPASSYRGPVDVATIMQSLATQIGAGFENNGVTGKLPTSYFPGTAWAQIEAVAQHANIEKSYEKGILAIWPKGGSRGGLVPLISRNTGLVGMPTIGQQNNIRLRTLYNPQINLGTNIKVESSTPRANGVWNTYWVEHDLASETPDGPWFTTIEASPPGRAQPVV